MELWTDVQMIITRVTSWFNKRLGEYSSKIMNESFRQQNTKKIYIVLLKGMMQTCIECRGFDVLGAPQNRESGMMGICPRS